MMFLPIPLSIMGSFEPDPRITALHERLAKYYKDTPDSMDNRVAQCHYRDFKVWCDDRGYTQEEICKAKRSIYSGI